MARRATVKHKPAPRPGESLAGTYRPPAPAIGAPPGPAALPVDPLHTEAVGANQLLYDSTMGGIGFGRTQVGQEYGYTPEGAFDPSNPYSRAALLQRSFQQGQVGTTGSMAARGSLYSSAHQGQLDEGTFQYARGEDSLKRAAAGEYQRLTEAEGRANFDLATGNTTADSDRLGRLDPADTVPASSTPYWITPELASWAAAGRKQLRQTQRRARRK